MNRVFALLTAASVTVALTAAPVLAAPVPHRPTAPAPNVSRPPALEGKWVVGVSRPNRAGRGAVSDDAEALGARVTTDAAPAGAIVVDPGTGTRGDTVVADLRDAPGVTFVEPVVARHVSGTVAPAAAAPNDTAWGQQWNLGRIGLLSAWDITMGSPAVKIAILDTGVDYTQPDLAGRIDTADALDLTVSPAGTNADDAFDGKSGGHGTHVAGIAAAAANNAYAIAGIAPGCTVLPIRIFDKDGNGDSAGSAAAIQAAADRGARVINMSYSGIEYTKVEAAAVAYALSKGCVLVAAAGNDASDVPEYPASFAGVIAVSATNQSDKISAYSSFGGDVDIAAPGGDDQYYGDGSSIVSLRCSELGGGVVGMAGTSMAAPHVSGAAALLLSSGRATTNAEVISRLVGTASDLGLNGWDGDYGAGLVRPDRALAAAPATTTVSYPDLGGADRYATAVKISREAFPHGAGTVIIATGSNYPDALGASCLAGAVRGPILLVPGKGEVPPVVLDEITRLKATRALVIGGTAVVPDTSARSVARKLGGLQPRWFRIGGTDRYETAVNVARRAKAERGSGWTGEAYLTTGRDWSDALSVSPISYSQGIPVLLAPVTAAGWGGFQAACDELGVRDLTIVGDASRVPTTVEKSYSGAFDSLARVGAPAGTATSLLAANLAREYGHSWGSVGIARADSWPDALTGGPLLGERRGVLVLSPGTHLTAAARWELVTHRVETTSVDFLGGTGVLTDDLRKGVHDSLTK